MRMFLASALFPAALLASAPIAMKNSVGMEFIRIAPGTMQVAVFQPSCPSASDPILNVTSGKNENLFWTPADLNRCRELAQRDASAGFRVTIKRPFYIGKFEVTQAEWLKVMKSNPSIFQGAKVVGDASRHPVDSVDWASAQQFVQRLNIMEHTHAYRLPTEFEWEYAGRAGGPGQVAWDNIRAQAVQGLRSSGERQRPTPQVVGSKLPNAWGLYDMLGNVWEWVSDFYNEKTFPDRVPPVRGRQHVLKGASFVSDVKNAIYATHGAGPGDGWDVGFRIVKESDR